MGLAEKMCRVAAECSYVQKDAANAFHKYRYASAASILAHVNGALVRHRVAVVGVSPSIVAERGEGKERVVTARVELTLADADGDERATIAGLGSGMDAGDKAVMKAMTAATKYAWMVALSISTGDDPEADEDTDERTSPQPLTAREVTAACETLRAAATLDALRAAWADLAPELARASDGQRSRLARAKDARKLELTPQEPPPDGTSGPRRGPGPVTTAEGSARGSSAPGGAPVASLVPEWATTREGMRAHLADKTCRAAVERSVRLHGKRLGRAYVEAAAERVVALDAPGEGGLRLSIVGASQMVERWAHEGPVARKAGGAR